MKGKRRSGWKNIKNRTGMDFASSVGAAETGQDGKKLLRICGAPAKSSVVLQRPCKGIR